MKTYQTYLKANDSISFEESTKIYNQIIESANINDEEFKEYWEEMMANAIVYANTRAMWCIQDINERREVDEKRTNQHNAFMVSLKVIASYIKEHNWDDAAWFERLGSIKNDRKRFGDFACYLVYINSLNAR